VPQFGGVMGVVEDTFKPATLTLARLFGSFCASHGVSMQAFRPSRTTTGALAADVGYPQGETLAAPASPTPSQVPAPHVFGRWKGSVMGAMSPFETELSTKQRVAP
jgi:hypothetical protein